MDERLRRFLLGALLLGLAGSITLAETALALLAIRWVYRLVTDRASRERRWPLSVPFIAWGLASLLAATASASPAASLATAVRGLLLILIFYVLLEALEDVSAADRFMSGLLMAMAGVAVLSLVQAALCPSLAEPTPALGKLLLRCHARFTLPYRAHGFFSIYMTLAGVLSLVLLTTLPCILRPDFDRRSWRILAWLTGAVAFALTYVRGAWLGLVIGLAALGLLLRRSRIVLLGGSVLLVIALLLLPGVIRRVESIADPADPTTRERWLMWESGGAIWRDHPLLGVGPGQLKREYPRYAAPDALQKHRGHLHNTPLQVHVERGILGLAAWSAIFFAFFWRAVRILRSLPPEAAWRRAFVTGSVAAITGFLVGGLTEYNFGDSEVVLVAYTVMALPFVVERAAREGIAAGG